MSHHRRFAVLPSAEASWLHYNPPWLSVVLYRKTSRSSLTSPFNRQGASYPTSYWKVGILTYPPPIRGYRSYKYYWNATGGWG